MHVQCIYQGITSWFYLFSFYFHLITCLRTCKHAARINFNKLPLKNGSPDAGGYVKFITKYIKVEGQFNKILSLQSIFWGNGNGKFQNPKTIPSGGYVKFTPKYIIVRGEGGLIKTLKFFQKQAQYTYTKRLTSCDPLVIGGIWLKPT